MPGELLKARMCVGGRDVLWSVVLTQQKEPPRGRDGGRHEVEDRVVGRDADASTRPHFQLESDILDTSRSVMRDISAKAR